MKCFVCDEKLRGKQTMFCSKKCKNRWHSNLRNCHDMLGVVVERRYIDTKNGYVKLYLSSGAVVDEHRYLVVNYLGVELPYNVVIHHIDGDVTNNSLDNLSVFSRSDHARFHQIGGVPPVSVLRRHQLLDELFQESIELGLAY
jgi:hypothetical protein